MPPSILLPLRPSSLRCQSCIGSQKLCRSISSSPRIQAIGPESPKFIEVPQPLQPRHIVKRQIKGVLPTPRNVFHRRGPKKPNPKYFAAVTPEPKSDASSPNPDTAQGARLGWKERMAASRRRNLREGLTELYDRKKQMEHATASRSHYWRVTREALVHQKEREDERLTNPTILPAMRKFQKAGLPDPHRDQRIARKTRKLKREHGQQREDRIDGLHALYMQARTFITTEADLDALIDRIFVHKPADFRTFDGYGQSVWSKGRPETVQQLLKLTRSEGSTAIEYNEGSTFITNERMKRIQEELTGGKM
ncbi:MAG: hypothetical protein M1812_005959 [Candelaria pacifica]|nr:MAG: hypothetical protein M1812_005959 [Candelaria pacifica]